MKNENEKTLAMLKWLAQCFKITVERGPAMFEKTPEMAYLAVRNRLQSLKIVKYTLYFISMVIAWVFLFDESNDPSKGVLLLLWAVMLIAYVITLRKPGYRIADTLAKKWIPVRRVLLKDVLPWIEVDSGPGRNDIQSFLTRMAVNMINKEDALLISAAQAQKARILRLINFFDEYFEWSYEFASIVRAAKDQLNGNSTVPAIRLTVRQR